MKNNYSENAQGKLIYGKVIRLLPAMVFFLSQANISFASAQYGKNAAKWFLDQAFWIVIAAALAMIGVSFVKRNITSGIVTLIVTAILVVLIKNPTLIESIGNSLKTIIGF